MLATILHQVRSDPGVIRDQVLSGANVGDLHASDIPPSIQVKGVWQVRKDDVIRKYQLFG